MCTSSHSTLPATMKLYAAAQLVSILVLATIGEITAAKLPGLRTINRNEENMINPGRKLGGSRRSEDAPRITQVSHSLVHTGMGERLELSCEASGSPPPTIQWIRGNNPAQQADLLESNDIDDHFSSGIATTKSRLVIDCVMPQHEGLYTCVATAGVHTTLAAPTMVLIPDNHVNNLTALLTACPSVNNMNVERPPRIVQWSPLSLLYIGDDVILPCRAIGYPSPAVYWQTEEKHISKNDGKFEVLPDGDLYIKNLQWNDRGEYKCVASNGLGKDSTVSAIYPALKS